MSDAGKQVEWMTIQQVADRWGVGYDVVLRDVKAKRIPALRVGTMYRVFRETIEQMEAEAKRIDHTEQLRKFKRGRAFVASGKDHFPGQ